MSKNELNVCPKCWSEDVKIFRDKYNWYRCGCLSCGIQADNYTIPAAAIAAWNERVPDPRLMKAIEEMKITGKLFKALNIIRKHLPETKESK